MKTLVLTGGGTAGHVLPHLALLPHLQKTFDKIYYIGSGDGIEREIIARQPGIEFFAVTCAKLRRSFDLRNLLIPIKLMRGTAEAKKILKQLKPTVVFSKGGFVSFPVVRAAARLKIPVIAHESDMTMGLANRLSATHCKIVCTTFAKTAEIGHIKNKTKFIHTGAPIRAEIFTGDRAVVEKRHAFSKSKNLLVVGGSLGAAKINTVLRESLPALRDFNIVHIAGRGKVDHAIKHPNYVQLEFAADIQNYFAWADIVISRAGSNALCELMALRKPTLFIPLSRAASRGDQIENAQEVLTYRAAMVIWEENLTSKILAEAIKTLYNSRADFSNNKSFADIDGTKRIAELITRL